MVLGAAGIVIPLFARFRITNPVRMYTAIRTEERLQQQLATILGSSLRNELGKRTTIILSTHILQEVEAICDRVIIINKGELVANDSLQNLRKTAATAVVHVSFGEKAEKALLETLSAATSIRQLDANNWQLATHDSDQLRKQILSLALQHNLNIVSLQSENQSLEDVFRSLTQSHTIQS